MKNKPSLFLLDVDGVMNNGQFIYSAKGKIGKIFGPDDNDALKILGKFITISFISSDYEALKFLKEEFKDMKFLLI